MFITFIFVSLGGGRRSSLYSDLPYTDEKTDDSDKNNTSHKWGDVIKPHTLMEISHYITFLTMSTQNIEKK